MNLSAIIPTNQSINEPLSHDTNQQNQLINQSINLLAMIPTNQQISERANNPKNDRIDQLL